MFIRNSSNCHVQIVFLMFSSVATTSSCLPLWAEQSDAGKLYGISEAAYMNVLLTRWTPDGDKAFHINRLIDIRWVFNSSQAAERYMREKLGHFSENMPHMKSAPEFGDQSYCFGGIFGKEFGVAMRSYMYIIRENNVIVKFYGAEFTDKGQLRPLTMAPICRKIVANIQSTAE